MIVWTDIETTGLDEREDHLLEVALVITDDELKEVAVTSTCVNPALSLWNQMVAKLDPVVSAMHTKNGLLQLLWPKQKQNEEQAALIEFMVTNLPPEEIRKTPLAGSTVGFDRRWLRHHMPQLEGLFSYRSIDVSALTELAKRWAPLLYENRPKVDQAVAHRALEDVRASIALLRYYRENGFIGLVVLK